MHTEPAIEIQRISQQILALFEQKPNYEHEHVVCYAETKLKHKTGGISFTFSLKSLKFHLYIIIFTQIFS